MYGGRKDPLDRRKYGRSADSRVLTLGEQVGSYVFVFDLQKIIHVAPDGSHVHPLVLGAASPAPYAGELRIDRRGYEP